MKLPRTIRLFLLPLYVLKDMTALLLLVLAKLTSKPERLKVEFEDYQALVEKLGTFYQGFLDPSVLFSTSKDDIRRAFLRVFAEFFEVKKEEEKKAE
jgi:hypothetical protein